MKTNIINTLFRTLLFLTTIVVLSLVVLFSCSGKSNFENDHYREKENTINHTGAQQSNDEVSSSENDLGLDK